MSDKLTVEKERHGEATGATIEAVIAAERQRCINRGPIPGCLIKHGKH
jgi:hypothetical protein